MKSLKHLFLALLVVSSGAHAITFDSSEFDSSFSQEGFFKNQDDILDGVNNGWFGIFSLDLASAPYSPALQKTMFGIFGGAEKRFFGVLGLSFDLGMRIGGSPSEGSSDGERGYLVRAGLPVYAVANKTWAVGFRPSYELGFWTAYQTITVNTYGYVSKQYKVSSVRTGGAAGSAFVTYRGAHLECGATKNLSLSTDNSYFGPNDLSKWCALGYKVMF
ncbi:MAG: hypothetical protein JST16_03555 [Bdellovibrionales bacterium]|nr:hypothetical protein [Bdellovibrionales bacterium]